ncbi:MAG TPA: FkbM family methyltransferase [Candidatus Limnocylindria bacterium]|nr:FkbM family methyltransferase [Candidatus Limnocylindria bacterium]
MKLARLRGHYIWTPPLTNRSVVVDAGAHRGEFSAEVIEKFGCQCHLIEANPNLAEKLSVPGAASITIAALGAADGRATFHVRDNPESGSLTSSSADRATAVDVETISLPKFMERIGVDAIDLLKLDIEGAEFDLVALTPENVWRRISQITVEFHDFQERFAGQRLFENARARLESLGFVCCLMSFRTHGDVLFLNRRLSLTVPQRIYARHLARLVEKARVLSA